ncbi:MAG TPA: hypothetical protein VII06_13760 [Chloroflexota bacterium]|jgi:hypothetical protein
MHLRIALAVAGALGLATVGAFGNPLDPPAGAGSAQAQLLPTRTGFTPRPLATLGLPTLIPTPGLPANLLQDATPGVLLTTPTATPSAPPTASPPPAVSAPSQAPSDSAPAPVPAAGDTPPPAAPSAPPTAAPTAPPLPTNPPGFRPDTIPVATLTPTPTSPPSAAPPSAAAAPDVAPAAPGALAPSEPETPPRVSAAEAQPPAIRLRFGTALYDGVRGSYCWSASAAPGTPPVPGLCADVPPPAFETVLAWPAGEPLELLIDGPQPSALTLQVFGRPTDPMVLQTELPPGTDVTWTPTVDPGGYVLAVMARWPAGDVVYYFPVGILDAASPGGELPATPSYEPGDGVVGPPIDAVRAPEPPAVAVPEPPAAAAPPARAAPAMPAEPAPPALSTTTTAAPSDVAVAPSPAPARASSAGPPSASPAAEAAAPDAAADRVLLRDDFTDTSSGFPLESRDPSARRLGYVGGEYRVARLAGSGGAAFVAHPERYADFLAEIDARLLPPTDGAYVFLDFRRQENGDYYSFLVDASAGRFLLLRHTDDDDTRLIDWTESDAIEPDIATNRLAVRARGSAITLFVGDTEVGRAQDGALRAGWIGFGVGSLDDDSVEGRFAHLLVTAVE